MSNDNYFEIENLLCSYNGRKMVLKIDHLHIPKGKVVFIVGESGCGKSTILETLGLMNNTICNPSAESRFVFKPNENETIDCLDIWRRSNRAISEVRRKYFSFIFQQTNLMPNFSIRENALLLKQIKSGQRKERRSYVQTLEEVGLQQILVEKKERVQELSGGQQQRLAFVRAFMSPFHVLLGDEPTGNLDPENARVLMELIYNEIHSREEGEHKSAIIVSHTPELYSKYGDIIVKIRKEREPASSTGEMYGVIDESCMCENQ